ncbi:reticulon-1a isoform X1 [Clarias gariepinus]|uniref:reticulon-1a isoform X1 n=1 Tax=Clarias gariepinus TaxID=13013 RepID=UPI00234D26C1|nr:reticulon-1a isoform X1 [Clarias gariepinus]
MSGTGDPHGEEREPCFGRVREEEEEVMKAPKPTCPGADAHGGAGVTMETASPDFVSDLFLTSSSGRSDLYTSLHSSNSSSSNPFSASVPPFAPEDDRPPLAPLGSDSGIGMTPGDPADLHSQKSEPYNYMDMSNIVGNHGNPGSKKQPISSHTDEDDEHDEDDEDASLDFETKMEKEAFDLGRYLEKNSEDLAVKGDLGNTFPFVEDQSDDELLENRPRPSSPVKITVTVDSCILVTEQVRGVSERESVLSLGKEGTPTVTLSEPEDDSAASSVNHSPNHSPTGRESPSDILFQPVGMKYVNNSALYQDIKGPANPSSRFGMRDSGESGDSEVEPDSPRREKQFGVRPGNPFDPRAAGVETNPDNKGKSNNLFVAPVNARGEFIQHGNPPLYSLLREEREAELDSDLLIESASEESPKREQVVKCTLKPSSPPSSPPPVSSALSLNLKQKEQEVKEEKKEKPNAVLSKISVPQPQEEKTFTKEKPDVMMASFEQRPLEEGGCKSTVTITEEKRDVKEAELLLFMPTFNKQKVVELLHWRDMKQTSVLFGSVLLLLFSLTQFSVVSVMAYLALAALSTTISFRVYKSVLQAVQKTDDGHPFKAYLEKEISLSPEQISKYVEKVQLYVNCTVKELCRLFLVQDLVDSLKFAVLMWLLTYVGALFNGLTLLILAVVCVFTVPLVYEKYQKQIDQYLGLVRSQVNSVMTKLREKVPGAKKKDE